MSAIDIRHGDCLDVLRAMPDNSVDAIVTDPPYGLANTSTAQVFQTMAAWVNGDTEYVPEGRGFMGKAWDGFVPSLAVWIECLRVLKPGGHILAAAGSRTQYLMGIAMVMAGFEMRDVIAWINAQGFPKSMDVSKAIDKAAGAERTEVIGHRAPGIASGHTTFGDDNWKGNGQIVDITAPATDEAKAWAGWGTAVKPAYEPFILARKPLAGTVAQNVLEHGTGALNIDACRIQAADAPEGGKRHGGGIRGNGSSFELNPDGRPESPAGRFPANVILDESQAAALDAQSGITKSQASKTERGRRRSSSFADIGAAKGDPSPNGPTYTDEGGASRFFKVIEPEPFRYIPKAGKKERPVVDGVAHPTVKPLGLMEYMVELITPPGGTVLDPFAGSGTTVEAAIRKGFAVIGIEREAEYLPLIQARIDRATQGDLAQAA